MDIRSSLDGLKTILGVTPAASAAAQKARTGLAVEGNSLTGGRATLRSAGRGVAQSGADGGVGAEKVGEIQAGLQAGSYGGPASAVATKMVDAMLERGK